MAANNVEAEYIVVCECDKDGSECLELPVDPKDNSLGLQTLTCAFPNAHGLKFKNPATGAYRALLTDSCGTRFFQPSDGWQGKLYVVITQQPLNQPSIQSQQHQTQAQELLEPRSAESKIHVKSDQNAKRRKLMVQSDPDEEQSSDSDTIENSDVSKSLTAADKRVRQSGLGSVGALKQKRLNSGSGAESVKGRSTRNLSGSSDELPVCTDLIVLGLPFKTTESEIQNYFKQFGNVSFVDIKKKLSGGSKGFGFVRMETFEGQVKVLNKPIHVIGNRKCQVRVPFDKNGEIREDPLVTSKVFVGRLQEKTTVSEIKKFFSEEVKKVDADASVIDVYIPKPFRAFAFVTFSNPKVAKKMIKLSGFLIDGAAVSIQSAQPKSTSQNSLPGPSSSGFLRNNQPYLESDSYYEWYDSLAHGSFRNDIFPGNPQMPHLRLPSLHNGPSGVNSSNNGKTSSGHYGSQIIASGLETLNLNNMKPELVTALKALMSAHKSGRVENSESPPPLMTTRGVGGGRISPSSQRLYGAPPSTSIGAGYMSSPALSSHRYGISSRRSGGNGSGNSNCGSNGPWR